MAANERVSEAQLGFMRSLFRQKDTDQLTPEQVTFMETYELRRLNRAQASRVITALQKLDDRPKEQRSVMATRSWPDIRAGRYAVEDPDDGVLKFYHVDRPTDGRWKGYTFLKVRASDTLYPIRDRQHMHRIMVEIGKNPKEAMLRFGREIGACGHCGRTLTNEESREYGIGPICRGKMGW
jgi:Family of unknown function (DUF6011)